MAIKQKITYSDWLSSSVKRVAIAHFLLLAAYAVQTIAWDAWHVIVPEIVLKRWIVSALLLAIAAVIWYLAHNRTNDIATYKRLTFLLIFSDILFAAYNIYIQRGMASKSVILLAIPIAIAGILLSRSALYATAALSTAAYIIATVSYFVLHFNEGYKTELYGEVGFYTAVFFVFAALLSAVVRFGGNTADR